MATIPAQTDFNTIMADTGTALTIVRVTKSLDTMTGDETLAETSAHTGTGIILKPKENYDYAKDGLLHNPDFIFSCRSDTDILKNDIVVTPSTGSARVDTVREIMNQGETAYKRVFLFLDEED